MFENAPIGVNDKNGKPIKNGDIVQTDIRNGIRRFRVFYDQVECAFKLRQLNVPFNHAETILNYILNGFFEVVEGG